MNTTWKADYNIDSYIDNRFLGMMGINYSELKPNVTPDLEPPFVVSKISENLPDEFDSRVRWPNCPTIREIRDQGSCGACWAFAAAEAMSDRVCIHSSQTKHFHFSALNLLSCCDSCEKGCLGCDHHLAWDHWVKHGIVSGGSYGSKEGCQPYHLPPCEHHRAGPRRNCTKYGPTPSCARVCQPDYKISYEDDLHFGKQWYALAPHNEKIIRTEIFHNGPVEATMAAYEDFYTYESGIYHHIEGTFVCDHAVKIIGWGTDKKTNTPYWLVANSFNTDWGEYGFFKIKRGVNECGIENKITAGIPAYKNSY
uniref:Procathepsin B n=1 Tax=Phenacoccus solenopsis TaxID=483260 RepID=K0BV31_9HEMI|nr:procathepsin B precursor [Phenacoccus solenopsis]